MGPGLRLRLKVLGSISYPGSWLGLVPEWDPAVADPGCLAAPDTEEKGEILLSGPVLVAE